MTWYYGNQVYSCRIENQIIPDDVQLELSGKHHEGKTNFDVGAVYFGKCQISKVPQGLSKIFPNMKFLRIFDSNLRSVKRDDLKEYSNLVYLSFANNKLELIPGDLLADMTQLQAIGIPHNNLKIIEPNLFNGLKNLKYASIRENPCSNRTYDSIGNTGNSALQDIVDEIREKFSN